MKLIFSFSAEKRDDVEHVKNILMESTNATLEISERKGEIVLTMYFYKLDEMHKIFDLMKNASVIPDKVLPAKFINRIFPSKEEKEARKFFNNGE